MALYQVNGESNEEDGDYKHDERKTLNPDYLYLYSCLNYHQMLKKSAKKYLQNIRASDKTLCGNCNSGVAMSEEKGDYRYMYICGLWNME